MLANTQQQIKSVMNDTSFATPIVKPGAIVKQDTATNNDAKNDVKKAAVNKPAATPVKKTNKPVVIKKKPKAVMKKP